jgi:hypothetical protein
MGGRPNVEGVHPPTASVTGSDLDGRLQLRDSDDDTGVVTLSVDPANMLVQLYELVSVTHPDSSVGFQQQQVVACAQATVDVIAQL